MTSRSWCFTENENPEALLAALQAEWPPTPKARFLVCQLEEGENHHLHLQGYVEFSTSVRLAYLKKHLSPTAHFEKRRGTREEARDYCRKADSRVEFGGPFEFGKWTAGGRGRRNDLAEVQQALDQGHTEMAIAQEFFPDWVRYHRAFDR